MAGEKNFNIKNGLSVGGVEVINSSGDLVAGGIGNAVNEAIADKIGGIVSATGGATATYNDGADTIVIDVAILDSDTMSGASATTLSSSESIKAYVDSVSAAKDDLSELSGDTDDVSEGSSNLYYTDARADARVTAASDLVRTTGTQSIAGVKTFSDNLILSGNLTVNGTQTTINTETLTVDDNMIVLNNNEAGTPSQDAGVEVERGTSTNVKIQFKESTDKWQFTNDGSSYVDIATDTDSLTEGSTNLYHTTARARGAISAGGDLAYNSTTGVISFTNDAGDISSVVAGSGLTGGATSGDATLNIGAGSGITVNADTIEIDTTLVATLTGTQGLTNKTITSPVINTGVSGSAILDSDTMSGASATTLSSSESIKAYVDSQVQSKDALSELSGDTDDVSEGTGNLYFTNERVDDRVSSLIVGGTGITASYNDSAGTLTLTSEVGDITSVVAGDGLTGGGTTGDVTLTVGVDNSSVELNSDALRVKALGITDGMLAGNISNSKLTNSGLTVNGATIALGATGSFDTDATSEGSSNLYHTTERVQDVVGAMATAGTNITLAYDDTAGTLTINSSGKTQEEIEDIVDNLVVGGVNITATYVDAAGTLTLDGKSDAAIRGLVSAGGDLAYNSSTGVISFTERTDAQVRGLVDVSDAGGDGSLAYNSSTGVITYTGGSASETRAHLSAGTGVTYSGGAFSIGQAVATSSDVAFNDLTLAGDLVVNGTTTTVSSTNTTMTDGLIELGYGTTGTPANDTGIVIERGDSANAFIGFDESADKFTMGTGTFTGATTGNLSITTGTLVANVEGNLTGNVTGTVSSLSNHSTSNVSEGSNLYFTNERAQDAVGGMFTGNTESGITVTYNDGDSTVDFSVGTLNQSTTGNAATATTLQTARNISGVSFNGSADITLNTSAITENSNLYYTDVRARAAHSHVAGAGAYNSTTGAITSATHTSHLTNNSNFAVTGASASFTTLSTTNASNSGGVARNVYQSTSAPTAGAGIVGDLWVQYS